MVGDGSISTSGSGVSVCSADLQIIEMLKSAIGSGHKIGVDNRSHRKKPSYTLNFKNKRVYKRLVHLGLVPRKSWNKTFCVRPPKRYLWSFLRGLLDSDGTFALDRNNSLHTTFLCSSHVQLEWIRLQLWSGGVRASRVHPAGKQYRVTVSKQGSLVLLSRLYSGNPSLYLDRKRSKALKILEQKDDITKRRHVRHSYPSDGSLKDLLKRGSIKSVANRLGIPYTSLYDHVRRRPHLRS